MRVGRVGLPHCRPAPTMSTASSMASRSSLLVLRARSSPLLGAVAFALGAAAAACNEAPRTVTESEQAHTYLSIAVDRTEPMTSDAATGSASAIARFVSIPAYSDSTRVLVAAGTSLDLPPADACATSGAPEGLEPPLSSLDPVEFLEAGDVAIA